MHLPTYPPLCLARTSWPVISPKSPLPSLCPRAMQRRWNSRRPSSRMRRDYDLCAAFSTLTASKIRRSPHRGPERQLARSDQAPTTVNRTRTPKIGSETFPREYRLGTDLTATRSRDVRYLRKAEDLARSKALRPTRAHRVVGCASCSLPQCRVDREFHEKGSSAASLAVRGRKLESVTPTSSNAFRRREYRPDQV